MLNRPRRFILTIVALQIRLIMILVRWLNLQLGLYHIILR